MAIPWPRRATWPTPLREHATNLSTFLHDVLHTIERNGSQTVPADLAGDVIRGALTFVIKTQHTPDLGTICDALRVAQTEAKASAEQTAQALDQIKGELKTTVEMVQQAAVNIQHNSNTAEEARSAAKEAREVGKATLEMAREIKNKVPPQGTNGPVLTLQR
jgi:methyl-accepting chemotaxis protein